MAEFDSIVADWQGLAAADVYETPERGDVLDALSSPSTVANMIEQNAALAAKALDGYAAAVASLRNRRAALIAQVETANRALADGASAAASATSAAGSPTPSPGPTPSASNDQLTDDIRTFNATADQADQECADALRRLRKYSESTVRAVATAAGGGGLVGVGTGAGSTALEIYLERWRQIVLVPEGSVNVRLTIPEPDDVINGVPYWRRPTGVYDPHPPAPELLVDGPTKNHYWWSRSGDRPVPAAVPSWVKAGGRTLGAVGAGVTVYATGSEQWTEDLMNHPEWSDSKRWQSAAESAVIVGGTSAVTGAAGGFVGAASGAVVGAAAGAAVGSVVPILGTAVGGVVGGVVGGIVGGAVMGYAMGDFGSFLGEKIEEDLYDGSPVEDSLHDRWQQVFG